MNPSNAAPDVILHGGRITTLDRANPVAEALAIAGGRFSAVGRDADIVPLAGPRTRRIDLAGRTVLPGLIDNHLHIIRGGLNFNMELRWDGVRSLADAMAMLKRQVAITPPPQWVRVVGGFTEHQFAEKRLPSIEELNAVAPDTPVFLLHLYDRALLNGAALRAVGYTKDTPNPPGGEIVRDGTGTPTGLLLAQPNAGILYATLAKGPKLPFEYQLNSTRHFMRELNRLGVTGAIDAGGGFQNYPDDYAVIQKLADDGQLTIRLAYNLFTQKPKAEKDDFVNWTKTSRYQQGSDYFRHNGAGEMLVFLFKVTEDLPKIRLADAAEPRSTHWCQMIKNRMTWQTRPARSPRPRPTRGQSPSTLQQSPLAPPENRLPRAFEVPNAGAKDRSQRFDRVPTETPPATDINARRGCRQRRIVPTGRQFRILPRQRGGLLRCCWRGARPRQRP